MNGSLHFNEFCCISWADEGNCGGYCRRWCCSDPNCEGILTSEVFLICNEYLVEILAAFLVYKAVIQDGGFASEWNGVGMVQNCPFASWQSWTVMVNFHCHGFILHNTKILIPDVIAGCKITMWYIQSKNFIDGKLLWSVLNWCIYKK